MLLNFTGVKATKILRILRVIRVLRVLKLARTALQDVNSAKEGKSNPIVANLRIYFIALFSVLMISSTLMYHIEGGLYTADVIAEHQALLDADLVKQGKAAGSEKYVPTDPISGNSIPEDKQFFTSIPTAMWWCIVTLTTTGYGDLYPVTVGGRIVAGITMFLGLVLFGMLMNIVGKTLMVLLFGESLGHEEKHDSKPTNIKEALNMLAEAGVITPKSADDLSKLDKKELSIKFDIK
jgi:voltage-gated potassium channel Kch